MRPKCRIVYLKSFVLGLRSIIENLISRSRLTKVQLELRRVQNHPRLTPGYAYVFDKPFKFNDGVSFVVTYNEIFVNNMYKFKPVEGKNIILDCGANMGLSVLFFALNYPEHKIIAFEPDEPVYRILKENIASFGLTNVELLQNAVWNKEETLEFYTDQGMGGRVSTAYKNQEPTRIETKRLSDYLTPEVDFLKLDIEGAEDVVLKDCKDKLAQLSAVFFEYHNDVSKPQSLHQLLQIVKDAGFHYYIKESGVRTSPFTDTELICENFDMAINVFCYK